LLTIFRQISAGELRIPAFQREFVWKNNQIIELLESVRLGYPVGSILLWYVETKILKIAAGNRNSFPDMDEKYPTNFILDGMQRLSSLYGVFHFGDTTSDDRFDVWFDLESEYFFHRGDAYVDDLSRCVPLAALFVPKKLLSFQADFAELDDSDLLIDRLVQLQASFQEYMIPVVQIKGEDIRPIVNIFERVNSTGTTLGRVDFMIAITWDQSFDLADALDETRILLEDNRFAIGDESIIKCIALQLDVDPSGDALLSLRHHSPYEMRSAFGDFRRNFMRVIEYLKQFLQIHSSDFIPYEGQLLVLYKAIGLEDAEDAYELDLLRRWFWATSFNESLRGKPDHYVSRAVGDWRAVVGGRVRGLEPRLRLADADFLERRLIRGKALSTAVACMFAFNGALSVARESAAIGKRFMLLEGDTSCFHHVIPMNELRLSSKFEGSPGRVFANLVVSPAYDGVILADSIKQRILDLADSNDWEVLYSQFFDEDAISDLRFARYDRFLQRRAQLMRDTASRMVGDI
jgi:hypothetical protein